MFSIDKFITCIIKLGKIHNFIIKNLQSNNIDNMRKFHNFIKLKLIVNACLETNAINLLDIACGRGGDLQKWLNKQLKLKYILAVDNHKESIYSSLRKGDRFDGAIARFLNFKKNYKGKLPFINFKYADILDPNIIQQLNSFDSGKLYNVISCQFALHYFCENDNKLNDTLEIISSKLTKNGLFIGTATDGDLIKNILDNGNVSIPLLTLVHKHINNYLFFINTNEETKIKTQNYFEVQGVSSEYYLFKEKLSNLALKHNLKLINYISFYDWYQIYKSENLENKSIDLTPYEMVISFLNFSFTFQKII